MRDQIAQNFRNIMIDLSRRHQGDYELARSSELQIFAAYLDVFWSETKG